MWKSIPLPRRLMGIPTFWSSLSATTIFQGDWSLAEQASFRGEANWKPRHCRPRSIERSSDLEHQRRCADCLGICKAKGSLGETPFQAVKRWAQHSVVNVVTSLWVTGSYHGPWPGIAAEAFLVEIQPWIHNILKTVFELISRLSLPVTAHVTLV